MIPEQQVLKISQLLENILGFAKVYFSIYIENKEQYQNFADQVKNSGT